MDHEDLDNRFLKLLHSDHREAEARYRIVRAKLILYFAHNSSHQPEELADEVVARVVRRIADGVEITVPLSHYCHGVAERILRESWRRAPEAEVPDNLPSASPCPPHTLNRMEQILLIEECFRGVSNQERQLFEEYHNGDRVALATRLGTSGNALRIRVYRIRQKLTASLEGVLDSVLK